MKTKKWLIAAIVVGSLVSGCGEVSDGNPGSEPASLAPDMKPDVWVEAKDFKFEAARISVRVDQSVGWHFTTSSTGHNVVFEDPIGGEEVESPVLKKGDWGFRFTQAGVFSYRCTLHTGMTGVVTVTP